jgi:hypothetical protein
LRPKEIVTALPPRTKISDLTPTGAKLTDIFSNQGIKRAAIQRRQTSSHATLEVSIRSPTAFAKEQLHSS